MHTQNNSVVMSEMPLPSLFFRSTLEIGALIKSTVCHLVVLGSSSFKFRLNLAFLLNTVRSCIISSFFFPGHESEDRPSYA